jgi:hypothetical protein
MDMLEPNRHMFLIDKVLPKVTSAKILVDVPKKVRLNTLKLLPNWLQERIESIEPIDAKLKRDRLEPHLTMLLIETVEPQMPLSIIETFIMEPTHCRPCKLNALPTLAVPLKERLDIMSTKLRTEMLLPHRANERIDTLEPKCKKSITEVLKQEPSATLPNTLRLEPDLN